MLDSNLETLNRKFFIDNIPEWTSFQIKVVARYLWIILGPAANFSSWIAPCAKMIHRSVLLGRTPAPSCCSIRWFNSRIYPVASYVAQILPIPPRPAATDLRNMHGSIHAPPNMLSMKSALSLDSVGLANFQSVMLMAWSAAVRFHDYCEGS